MSAKTRMNNAHREVLREFAYKKITEVVDLKQEQKLYEKLVKHINAAIRKRYPEKDIEVLGRYKLTDNCYNFLFQYPSGQVTGFTCSVDEKYPISEIAHRRKYSSEPAFPMTQEFENLLQEYGKVHEENIKIINQKKIDCNTLINFAKYVEDVIEVIKVPDEVRKRLCARSTALVALTPEVIERIQKDFMA
jgi:hypothetical protein